MTWAKFEIRETKDINVVRRFAFISYNFGEFNIKEYVLSVDLDYFTPRHTS